MPHHCSICGYKNYRTWDEYHKHYKQAHNVTPNKIVPPVSSTETPTIVKGWRQFIVEPDPKPIVQTPVNDYPLAKLPVNVWMALQLDAMSIDLKELRGLLIK